MLRQTGCGIGMCRPSEKLLCPVAGGRETRVVDSRGDNIELAPGRPGASRATGLGCWAGFHGQCGPVRFPFGLEQIFSSDGASPREVGRRAATRSDGRNFVASLLQARSQPVERMRWEKYNDEGGISAPPVRIFAEVDPSLFFTVALCSARTGQG